MSWRILTPLAVLAGCLIWLGLSQAAAQGDGGIDWGRARELYRRAQQGETLTPDERAYLDRAREAHRRGADQTPVKPPAGLKPLSDMSAKDRYKGEDGGLYGGGANRPPDGHLQAALRAARLIRPVDARGQPAEAGKIVLLSVGKSNTTQEFQALMPLAAADQDKSPQVVLVDGAQGGMTAAAWANPNRPPRPDARSPWEVLDGRLRQAGLTPEQVQAVWIKEAQAQPARLGEFPKHAEAMKRDMVTLLGKLHEKLPNLRIAYLSSRTYGGFARSQLNPEPYAYESAFVVRWLVRDQIAGEPTLCFDAAKGEVRSPVLLWGPYLWADGPRGRKLDDLVWKPEDFGPDGTHPSPSGRQKVAGLLLRFLKTDPTAKIWFVRERR